MNAGFDKHNFHFLHSDLTGIHQESPAAHPACTNRRPPRPGIIEEKIGWNILLFLAPYTGKGANPGPGGMKS